MGAMTIAAWPAVGQLLFPVEIVPARLAAGLLPD